LAERLSDEDEGELMIGQSNACPDKGLDLDVTQSKESSHRLRLGERRFISGTAGQETMSEDRVKVVACIPAFNEEDTIERVLLGILRHVDEAVVVDDGSKDQTSLIARRLGALVIVHSKNLGKGVAIRDGLGWAKDNNVDILVTLDADGQHDPDDIPELIEPLQAGEADIVIGSRIEGRRGPASMNPITLASNQVVSRMFSLRYGGHFTDLQSGYRAFGRNAIAILSSRLCSTRFEIELEVFSKAKSYELAVKEVTVRYHEGSGRTKFSLYQRLRSLYFAFKYVLSLRPPK
jgi:glycosyltransferase involved in cell wall biosynthesis